MTTEQIEKKFLRYKKKYFKGRDGFTGVELEQCRKDFERYLIHGNPPQKRFTKAYEIQAAILKYKRSAKIKLEAAEGIDDKVHGLIMKMNFPGTTSGEIQYFKEEAEYQRDTAIKLRRSVELIHDVKIPRLVRTLAAFNTETLPGMKDKTITLQK